MSDEGTEWFWRVVDAKGLGDVPSDEVPALRLLCDRAARAEELEAQLAEVREVQTISYTRAELAEAKVRRFVAENTCLRSALTLAAGRLDRAADRIGDERAAFGVRAWADEARNPIVPADAPSR